jgi:signal transduction histidine kinase
VGVVLAAVLPLSALFSVLVARRATRRLERLASAASALRQGDLEARVEVSGEDEVAQLQADFNEMAGELSSTLHDLEVQRDARRALVANVSHELRTPVATIRATIESALDHWVRRRRSRCAATWR